MNSIKDEATLNECKEFLSIDRAELDECLTEQPEIYYHVSRSYVGAVAGRDELKLKLEEETARQDQELRAQALRKDEKLTEAALQNKLRTLPIIQKLQTEFLVSRQAAEDWGALKEAFQQRSFMLRELVALYIAQRHDHALEAGAGQARATLAEQTRKEAGKLRTARRKP